MCTVIFESAGNSYPEDQGSKNREDHGSRKEVKDPLIVNREVIHRD